MNADRMNSEFITYSLSLNSNAFQRQSYRVSRDAITLRRSYLVNWNFFKGHKITAYNVENLISTVFPKQSEDYTASTNPKDVYLSMHFVQSDTQTTTSANKEAISNTFQRFGSFLALTMRFVGYVVGRWQKFNLDNSMMKKLYSYGVESDDEDDDDDDKKKRKKNQRGGTGGQQDPRSASPTQNAQIRGTIDEEVDTKQENDHDKMNKLKYEMRHRRPFSYSGWRLNKLEWFSNPWCLCCRKFPQRKDKLFKEGKKKLYEELDILEIIKKLRVNQFNSDLCLTQNQRDMVNFH